MHGTDGWELAEYDWDPETGIGSFVYERIVDGKTEVHRLQYAQPAEPKHKDWPELWRTFV